MIVYRIDRKHISDSIVRDTGLGKLEAQRLSPVYQTVKIGYLQSMLIVTVILLQKDCESILLHSLNIS